MVPYPEYQPPAPRDWSNYRLSHKIAASWGIQHSTVVRLFSGRPGVLRTSATDKDGIEHISLLIPRAVADNVRAKLWAFLAPSIDLVERV
jgi:hypothetical protein